MTINCANIYKLTPIDNVMKKDYYTAVYDIVRQVPPGRVTSYGAIADFLALGSARMVGYALKQLPSMMGEVPAHRVVNAKGELSGRHAFRPPGLMQSLLEDEGVAVARDKVTDFKTAFWHPEEML